MSDTQAERLIASPVRQPRKALYDASMAPPKHGQGSGHVLTELGIVQPDIELAKADLATRIQRLTEHRRLTADEATALLNMPRAELASLFQGRLATCSI